MANLKDTISTLNNIGNGALDKYIENALKMEVGEAVKVAVSEAAKEYVYDAYEPKFRHRRGELGQSGGITDPNSVTIVVQGNELIAIDDAEWQQLWRGEIPTELLADMIAEGNPRFNMQNAGPRPFHEKAKQKLIESGELDRALRQGLRRQGIDASGMTFEFI